MYSSGVKQDSHCQRPASLQTQVVFIAKLRQLVEASETYAEHFKERTILKDTSHDRVIDKC